MNPVQHIFLTGFMGSGKSTLGKKLARLMQLKFVDLDDYIEKKEHTSVQFIFDNYGEAAFREKETAGLEEIMASPNPLLIALGGGTVCSGENLKLIKQHGFLIYLEVPAAVLGERISGSKKKRPLMQGFSGDDLTARIAEKLEQRQPFYRQANITISGLDLTPQLLQQAILEAQQNYTV